MYFGEKWEIWGHSPLRLASERVMQVTGMAVGVEMCCGFYLRGTCPDGSVGWTCTPMAVRTPSVWLCTGPQARWAPLEASQTGTYHT